MSTASTFHYPQFARLSCNAIPLLFIYRSAPFFTLWSTHDSTLPVLATQSATSHTRSARPATPPPSSSRSCTAFPRPCLQEVHSRQSTSTPRTPSASRCTAFPDRVLAASGDWPCGAARRDEWSSDGGRADGRDGGVAGLG